MRLLILALALTGCGGIAWNTTVAESAGVRALMVESAVPGVTTEATYVTRWGNPTQKVREGGEVRYVYRNMRNADGYYVPHHGSSTDYVVVRFQYGLAVGAYSSDVEGCRGTFPPRPPGQGFDNPFVVYPANCGPEAHSAAIRAVPPYQGQGTGQGPLEATVGGARSGQGVTDDRYVPGGGQK